MTINAYDKNGKQYKIGQKVKSIEYGYGKVLFGEYYDSNYNAYLIGVYILFDANESFNILDCNDDEIIDICLNNLDK